MTGAFSTLPEAPEYFRIGSASLKTADHAAPRKKRGEHHNLIAYIYID